MRPVAIISSRISLAALMDRIAASIDSFNCAIPNNLGVYTKNGSGISAVGQPVSIITSPASSLIGFQFPAMRYVNNIVTPTQTFYEYYEVTFAEATFQEIANTQRIKKSVEDTARVLDQLINESLLK